MKYYFIKISLFACSIVLNILFCQFNAQSSEWTHYSTKGHPKANGLNISVRYPSYFTAREGHRPHIVHVFSDRTHSADLRHVFMLYINKLPFSFPIDFGELNESDLEIFSKTVYQDTDPNAIILQKSKIKHEGQNGVKLSALVTNERAGVQYTSIFQSMMITYKNNIISLQCQTASNNNDIDYLVNAYKQTDFPLCFLFFNSLILQDRYQ